MRIPRTYMRPRLEFRGHRPLLEIPEDVVLNVLSELHEAVASLDD